MSELHKKNYDELCQEFGEAEVRRILVHKLRAAADLIEGEANWPDIYGCKLHYMTEGFCKEWFIEGIQVTLSYPWPG